MKEKRISNSYIIIMCLFVVYRLLLKAELLSVQKKLTYRTTWRDISLDEMIFPTMHLVLSQLQTATNPQILLRMSLNKEQSVQQAVNKLEMSLFPSIGKAATYHSIMKSTAAH